ncbi:hypothetical protein VSDG_07707 [Cytospora chrysosperma]|uniref:chitinase n=1 Tax=Cytospora chrysosperma TaxID=252740 RepID=A0A423VJ80_CYTCH|nr:hypothetical protein VSDG_07707 [Valsa sordida]
MTLLLIHTHVLVCGLGPSYCGAGNCTSSCDAKSDCDPGWGSEWSSAESCPLNVCCSEYGFCGTTSLFCGTDDKVDTPSCTGGSSASQKIIGYYEGWSTTRACKGIQPENLLMGLYTHLNYAFAFVDPDTFEVATMQSSDTDFMPRLTALKNYNPSLEVWISIGGWSMTDSDQPTATTFSDLAGSEDAQQKFFTSLVSFMSTYGFDGVDIDWEYPVAPERSGKDADYENYVSFLKNLRGALGSNGHNYGLSITLPSSYWYLQNFDIVKIEPLVDWFNVMTYDLHGTWDSTDPYIGAIVQAHTNLTEIDQTMDLMWRNSIDPSKIVMGIGFYGRSFTLSDPSCTEAGCPFSAGGTPGNCSASAGTLMYSEIQDIIATGDATVVTDKDAAVQIVTWGGDQWVSYDDADTLKQKLDYANGKCLGGLMVWAASTDDNKGSAIQALAGAAGINSTTVLSRSAVVSNPGQCVWGECGASCPSGLVPVETSKSNASPLGIESGCNDGTRSFCCPADNPPTCSWKGSPKFCGLLPSNQCSDSEVEVAASTDGCWTGHKSLCCSKTDSDSDLASCKWEGAAPICSAESLTSVALGLLGPSILSSAFTFSSYGCDSGSDYPKELTTAKQGEGGQQSCAFNGGFKSYCCSDPAPWKNCEWKTGNVAWKEWESVFFGYVGQVFSSFQTDCKTSCDVGKVTVATDGFACRSGTYSFYCCDSPNTPTAPDLPVISLCPSPLRPEDWSSGLEEESSLPNVYEELSDFDDTCDLPSYDVKRGLETQDKYVFAARPHLLPLFARNGSAVITARDFASPYAVSELDERGLGTVLASGSGIHQLEPRGVRKGVMSLCSPTNSKSSLWYQPHPGASSIMRTTGKAFTVAQRGVCAALGVSALTTMSTDADWVTEHVLEKQEFRDAIEWMGKGLAPDGTTLTAGAVPWAGVFDDTGLFQNYWPSTTYTSLSNLVGTWSGNIADTFMGILGRTADVGLNNQYIANFQVCDADYNSYKEHIVAGEKFISDTLLAEYNPLEQIGVLSDMIDMMAGYRSHVDVVASYATTYTSIKTLWGDFARYATAQGVTYDFAGAWEQIIRAGLNQQLASARTQLTDRVATALLYWQSNSPFTDGYTATVVAANIATLQGWQSSVNTIITLPIASMAP